jgi:hypothetical protein
MLPASLRWLPVLRDPAWALSWSLPEWESALRSSRRLRLLARLAESLEGAQLLARVPPPPRRHLIAEQRLSRWRTTSMTWALEQIAIALRDKPYPLVLLKGGAYIGQDLPIAAGRLPSDLDILVPRAHLDDAVARLIEAGWQEQPLDEHDRRYYYEWSHEVPPMRHALHGIELDLHHNILPPVADVHVDADLLLATVRPSRWQGWSVLAPVDQLLHSAAHLFFDSEPRDRVRDLVDMDGLMRHFGSDASFWEGLPDRALELGLEEPFALAMHFTHSWLGTPIPPAVLEEARAMGPSKARRTWLVPLMARILTPADPDAGEPASQRLAATIILARYHWHRMPMKLLIPHLWHKWRGDQARKSADTAPAGEN